MLPVPIVIVTELLATPLTAPQLGLARLSVLSRVKPVDAAGQDRVTLLPAALIPRVGALELNHLSSEL